MMKYPHLWNAVNYSRIETEVNEPLVLGKVSQMHYVVLSNPSGVELYIHTSWNVKCRRRLHMTIRFAPFALSSFGFGDIGQNF